MHPLLETMLAKFDCSQEVVITRERNGRQSYLKCRIVDIRDTYLLVSTSNSIVRISPDDIVRIGQPQTVAQKPKKKITPTAKPTAAPVHKDVKKADTAPDKVESKPAKVENDKNAEAKKEQKQVEKNAVSTAETPASQEPSNNNRQRDWDPKMVIPKMGDVVDLDGDELTIKTNKNELIKVSRSIIIDKKLNKLITDFVVNKGSKLQIPVIWGAVGNEILCLLGLNTLEAINSRVNTSRDVGNTKVAYALALLLNAHSTLPTYVRQLESFRNLEGYSPISVSAASQKNCTEREKPKNYTKDGVTAKENGEFERALKLFQQAIDNDDPRKPTAFRELVNTLIILERYEEAYTLLSGPGIMDFTSPLLNGSSNKNFNWLSSCLKKAGHDDDVIRINLKRASEENITANNKASCYNRIAEAILKSDIDNPEDKAEEYYKKVLEIDPSNKFAKEGLASLRPEDFDLESIEEIIDLEPSSFAEDQLIAMPEDKRSKQYKDSLINQLRSLRSNSYSERANIHLQLASVEKALGHESNMHMDLSKYLLTSVLEGRRTKNLNTDSATFMLCESIAHWSAATRYHGRERRTTHYQDCLALFINLFNRQNPNYIFNSPKLYLAFENRQYENPEFYSGLPNFLQYRAPFFILMKDLWETSAQSSAINYLNENGFLYNIEEGKSKFEQCFKTISIRERAFTSDLLNQLRQMAKAAGYEEMKGRLERIGTPNFRNELDIKRFTKFKNFFDNTLTRYFHNEDITNKYYSQEDSLSFINSLLNEIQAEPTRLSYSGLKPILLKIQELVRSDYERLSENSKPRINISQSGDCTLQDDVLSFQLNIANDKGCLAINNFHIEISNSADVIEHLEGMKITYDSIAGGSDKNIVQQVRISQAAAAAETVTINVSFYHGTVGKSEEQSIIKKVISLHLRNDDIPESNPYSKYSGGKPIELRGRKMFYGRKDEIKSVADAMMSEEGGKQVIVYGQSRSGKTSFRNMLAIELESRGAWCAKFSLQDAYPTSLASFFAVIMDRIVNILYEELDWKEEDFKYAVSNHTTVIADTYKNTPEASISSLYTNDLCALQKAIKIKLGKKMILMIDEFTELYTWIKRGLVPDSVMKIWKAVSENERLDYSVVLIGQDTTPLFMREPYASNPFQVIEPRRMSYLPAKDARDMIENPILDKEKKSRFVGKAVDKIIEYTAGSPYYLMIFCSKLVEYMIERKIGKVTDVDVDEVARICISDSGMQDKFDNLYAAVEPPAEEKERSKSILKAIAIGMARDKDGASREEIQEKLKERYDIDEISSVLTDLEAREVVSVKQNISDSDQDKFTINVIIFQRWLLEN